jgi:hypothetical protein
MVKKVVAVYIEEEYVKALRDQGYNISRLVENFFRAILAGEEEEFINALKKNMDVPLPSWSCECGSQRFVVLSPFHGMKRIKCKRCGREYIYNNNEWCALERAERLLE